IGQGSMTQERLEVHRKVAREELEARRECGILMPSLQGVFTRFFVEASAKTLEAMSDDDRRSLEDLLAKQLRGEGGEGGDGESGEGDGGD
ncbi:MAG: hypothetical protein KAJ35_03850, partial [Thermoplasmata archaeon]|nr:hypothetical protein [Thermoplasmata archaeon]